MLMIFSQRILQKQIFILFFNWFFTEHSMLSLKVMELQRRSFYWHEEWLKVEFEHFWRASILTLELESHGYSILN